MSDLFSLNFSPHLNIPPPSLSASLAVNQETKLRTLNFKTSRVSLQATLSFLASPHPLRIVVTVSAVALQGLLRAVEWRRVLFKASKLKVEASSSLLCRAKQTLPQQFVCKLLSQLSTLLLAHECWPDNNISAR